PWSPARTPGGSSSGSAAAVASGMCLGAIASQTGGSITRPAAFCGVAGIKPTYGRVSCHGVMPLAASMDHPGAVAPCVLALPILLQAMAGPDPLDPTASDHLVLDYVSFLPRPTNPPKLGRLHGLFDDLAEPITRSMMDRSVEELRRAGVEVIDVALPGSF